MERARQALQSPWRRLVAILALTGVVAAVVVFLVVPGSASGSKSACSNGPKFDYFTPKRGEIGDTIEIHGSKFGQEDINGGVDDVWFKTKTDWTQDVDFEIVGGVIRAVVPDDGVVDGPIALTTQSDCPKILSNQRFNVFPY